MHNDEDQHFFIIELFYSNELGINRYQLLSFLSTLWKFLCAMQQNILVASTPLPPFNKRYKILGE